MDEKEEQYKNQDRWDSRYSMKWVEKVLVWAGTIIGAALLIKLVSLVLIK